MLHKYFALGKVEFHRGRFKQARDALLFAEKCRRNREPVDFVYELLARVYLAMGEPERAMETVAKVPEKFRRPYYRWTEADALCAMGEFDRAKAVLAASAERDRRARHKALLKIAKIEYHLSDFEAGARAAAGADRFFREKWGNPYGHGLFWQALNLCRAGELRRARLLAKELSDHFPRYPKLDRLLALTDDPEGGGQVGKA
jgi:tetratricopeptide (TPR) repeat protein